MKIVTHINTQDEVRKSTAYIYHNAIYNTIGDIKVDFKSSRPTII